MWLMRRPGGHVEGHHARDAPKQDCTVTRFLAQSAASADTKQASRVSSGAYASTVGSRRVRLNASSTYALLAPSGRLLHLQHWWRCQVLYLRPAEITSTTVCIGATFEVTC